jgi:hypothetical protein
LWSFFQSAAIDVQFALTGLNPSHNILGRHDPSLSRYLTSISE